MNRYFSYRRYLKGRFGRPILKIPVNGGFSCPNRDGFKSIKGCTFCDNRSFSPVSHNSETPCEQLKGSVKRFSRASQLIIPYLQPFSNTYSDVETLRSVYEPLLEQSNVVGLAIGTRPDCFDEKIYAYLEELSKRTYLSVELGLQSGHDSVLKGINRGHTVYDFVSAVTTLASIGVESVAHVMLGLPGEGSDMIIETAQMLASLPLTGVKIHQLMIIEGTEMEVMFSEGKITTLSLDQYQKLLCDFLSFLRKDQHIHRLLADSKKEYGLIAPAWSAQKNSSLAAIYRYMDSIGFFQGSSFNRV
ncbi:TIGR01212 family radical SAM protein [Chitinispirillales bacterium ANBcel5]|uniref:TIGR01212 family radical SAM protein n=1 Tax=Cellulosispirillum alkaliphilum TaxID=3039283 RepID=UPI002A556EBD|nr:TIGR01212 family radical SAM protein [Chitinispirillales bacterium ANBcel5]